MSGRKITIGVSLKMYLTWRETLDWCASVAEMASQRAAILDGALELFVLPSAPALAPALSMLAPGGVGVGAQNISDQDAGPLTGETSPAFLRQMGCRYAEIGHAERRELFGENDDSVAAKLRAALRNDLIPVVCVGEPARVPTREAAYACVGEVDRLLHLADAADRAVIFAYEPVWAIGQAQPAPDEHVQEVTLALLQHVRALGSDASRVIYGGSAGPGLLSRLGEGVDGLFLGRFAHEPKALAAVLDEAVELLTRWARVAG